MFNNRLKHLPLNMIWCILSFIIPFVGLSVLTLPKGYAFFISLNFYLIDVKNEINHDVQSEKLSLLEDKINTIESIIESQA